MQGRNTFYKGYFIILGSSTGKNSRIVLMTRGCNGKRSWRWLGEDLCTNIGGLLTVWYSRVFLTVTG